MTKSRYFWFAIGWLIMSAFGTVWVTTTGEVPVGNAALVGAVGSGVVTVALAKTIG